MSDIKMYDILGQFNGLDTKSLPVSSSEVEPVYESVEPLDSVAEAVTAMSAKYEIFKESVVAEKKKAKPESPSAKFNPENIDSADATIQNLLTKARFSRPGAKSDLEAIVYHIAKQDEELERAKAAEEEDRQLIKKSQDVTDQMNARFKKLNAKVAAGQITAQDRAQAQAAQQIEKDADAAKDAVKANPNAPVQQIPEPEVTAQQPQLAIVPQTTATPTKATQQKPTGISLPNKKGDLEDQPALGTVNVPQQKPGLAIATAPEVEPAYGEPENEPDFFGKGNIEPTGEPELNFDGAKKIKAAENKINEGYYKNIDIANQEAAEKFVDVNKQQVAQFATNPNLQSVKLSYPNGMINMTRATYEKVAKGLAKIGDKILKNRVETDIFSNRDLLSKYMMDIESAPGVDYYYFYNVKPGQEAKAFSIGLKQSKNGNWYYPRAPLPAAEKLFGQSIKWTPGKPAGTNATTNEQVNLGNKTMKKPNSILEAVMQVEEGKKLKDKKQFDDSAEPGDYYLTDKGNKVIKTKSGIKHEKVHAADKDDDDDLDEAMFPGSSIGKSLRGADQSLRRDSEGAKLAAVAAPFAGAGAALGGAAAANTATGAAILFAPTVGAGALAGAGLVAGTALTYKALQWLARKVFGTTEEALEFAKAHLAAAQAGQPQFQFQGKNYPVKVKPNQVQDLKDEITNLEIRSSQKQDTYESSYSAKAARAGKDIGKPGKQFAKIAKSAGERYGSKERGEKVAGAVLKKLRADESAKPDFLDVDGDGDKKETFKKAVKDKKQVKESANPAAQKGAQAILQALSPEEEQQLAAIVKQAGNDPKRVVQALGITPELIQQAQQGQVAEGISASLSGKVIQALWTAGLLGAVAAGVGGHEIIAGNLAAPILMAAGAVWGGGKGQVGYNPDADKKRYEKFQARQKKEYDARLNKQNGLEESGGPYELYNPKHPKFAANYKKFKAKNPDAKLEDFIAAMKKKEHGVNEGVLDQVRSGTLGQSTSHKNFDPKTGKPLHGDSYANAANAMRKAQFGEGDDLGEVAPPGAKAERMVKHIKKGYSKDGKLTPKEKSIAYATAWKAHNKGQVEEATNFGDTIKNSKAKMTKVTVKEGKEAIRNHPIYTTKEAWDHYAQELAEQEAMDEAVLTPTVDAVQELDEIARLAGLQPKMGPTCEACGCSESACKCESLIDESMIDEAATRKDFRMVADLIKNIPDPAKRKELAHHHSAIFKQQNPRFKHDVFCKACGVDECGVMPTAAPIMGEAEMEEGNEFSGALAKAKASGAKEFEVDGKKYTVKEDININVSANGEEDVINLIRKLSGMEAIKTVTDKLSAMSGESCGTCGSSPCGCEAVAEQMEEAPKEREIEHTNTPREETAGADAAFPGGTDLNRPKKSFADKPFRGDNPMAVAEAKEEALWKSYEAMINDVKA